jgi:putative Holliday junction resolvase
MRPGVRIGVDVGRARVGVAVCDRDGLLATPVETVVRDDGSIARLSALIAEYQPIEVVVGLPLSLSGADTASTTDARDFASELATWLLSSPPATRTTPVRLVDERLSTVSAQRALRESGRGTRGSRPVIDQVAAVIILQNALDSERTAGRPPGAVVSPKPGGTRPEGR